jgi:transcription factor SPT20 homolog
MVDAQQICQEHGWGSEELLQLESVLCMAVAEPLCLSPNPALGDLAINRDRVAKQMQSTALQRTRRNLIANGTKRKPEPTNASEFRLYEFLRKKSRLGRTIPPILKVRCQQSS